MPRSRSQQVHIRYRHSHDIVMIKMTIALVLISLRMLHEKNAGLKAFTFSAKNIYLKVSPDGEARCYNYTQQRKIEYTGKEYHDANI